MRPTRLLLLIVALSLVVYGNALDVALEADLRACLEDATNYECVLTVASLTWTTGPADITRHKVLKSSIATGSTIDLNSFGFAIATDLPYGTSHSLSIEDITFINTGNNIGDYLFHVTNAALNLTNVNLEGLTVESNMLYGENSTGYWENVVFKDCFTHYTLFLQQDLIWTFINITFDNVRPDYGHGILRFNTFASDLPGCRVTFGGDITFLNIPYIDSGVGVSIEHDRNTSVEIYSLATNPSRFIVRDSNFSLFGIHATSAPQGDNSPTSIDIGSILIHSSTSALEEESSSTQFYIFRLDEELATNYQSLSAITNITILGDINTIGMGIVSRGNDKVNTPADVSNNAKLKVLGSINITHDGDLASSFRLTWPMDIEASSLTARLLPRPSDGLVPSFLAGLKPSITLGVTRFSIANAFNISSISNVDWMPSPSSPPQSSPQSSPAQSSPAQSSPAQSSPSPSPSSSSPHTPFSFTAPIHLDVENFELAISAGSMLFSNFSLPRQSSFNISYQGAAIHVSESSLTLTTTNGDISFVGNQNMAGQGGAIYVGSGGTITSSASSGNIIFSDNVAYYGGGFYENPSAFFYMNSPTQQLRFTRNKALSAGGAALLSHSQISLLRPPSSVVLMDNGAFHYGCVFAFGTTLNESDIWSPSCQNAYNAQNFGNMRIGSSYEQSTSCPVYETLCNPLPPPSAPSGVPSSSPLSSGCRSTSFIPAGSTCVNGTYQATAASFIAYINNSTVSSTTPKIGAPIVITGGNVTIPKIVLTNVLSFRSQRPMISSSDCISVFNVSVSLTEDDLETIESSKSITTTLVESSCSPSNATLKLEGAQPKRNCKHSKATAQVTSRSLLATFSITSSHCNTWWIILVSVICGILLFVIIFVIVVLLLPASARAKLQPFYKSKDAPVNNRSSYTNIN